MMSRLLLFVILLAWLLPAKPSGTFCEGSCKDIISSIEEYAWKRHLEEYVVKSFESMDESCFAKFKKQLHSGDPRYIEFSMFILEKTSDYNEYLIGELQYLLSINSDRTLEAIHSHSLTVLDIVCGTSTSKYYSMARHSINERLDAVLNSSLGQDFDPVVTRCIDKLEDAEREMLEGMWDGERKRTEQRTK
jgi:hypothetical protein